MKKALIIVDPQNDFVSGSLAVTDGNLIMPILSKLSNNEYFDIIIVTKDWHPADHVRFVENQKDVETYKLFAIDRVLDVAWPAHCIQDTFGAELHKDLVINKDYFIVEKGMNKDVHPYSGFSEDVETSEVDAILKMNDIDTVYIGGLATNYCVFDTAKDAVKLGYDTFIIKDCTKAIGDFDEAIKAIKEFDYNGKKIRLVNSDMF